MVTGEPLSCDPDCGHSDEEHAAFDAGIRGDQFASDDPYLREVYEIGRSVFLMQNPFKVGDTVLYKGRLAVIEDVWGPVGPDGYSHFNIGSAHAMTAPYFICWEDPEPGGTNARAMELILVKRAT